LSKAKTVVGKAEMPLYRVQFTTESCLTNNADITFPHKGTEVRFLFSKRGADDTHVRVQADVEAQNNRDAQSKAATEILPPVLDALSFATRTPLLLIECELILKDETGNKLRRAIFVGQKKMQTKIALHNEAVSEAIKLLQTEGSRLSQCWYRYALDRELTLEKFVFNWQAFEALAGDSDIPSRCPVCMEEIIHCGKRVTHRGTSKERAAEMFCSANPESTTSDFKNRVWNTARNRVFHGRSYPEPAYLAEVYTISESVRNAAEKQIAQVAGVKEKRPHHNYDQLFRVFHFVEWNTTDPNQAFASDWPKAELVRRTQMAELSRVFAEAPAENVTFLDYQSQSTDW
jgi:hypothetical protein